MKRFLTILIVLIVPLTVCGQDSPIESALQNVTTNLTDHVYTLQYKLRPGEKINYEVVHQVAVGTTVEGKSDESKSFSKSMKIWSVLEPDTEGHMRFSHSVERVKMWSETSGRELVRYDSETDKEDIPEQYRSVAETLGKPISTVVINAHGEEVKRDSEKKQHNFGTGGMMVPLPSKPVRVGDKWTTPDFVIVRQGDGTAKRVNTRVLFQLEKVETGIATISINTEVLTPIDDSRMKSQLIQRLTNGSVRFDIDAGRVVSRQLDWDETVVGFNGPESNMEYLARMTETLVRPRVASRK